MRIQTSNGDARIFDTYFTQFLIDVHDIVQNYILGCVPAGINQRHVAADEEDAQLVAREHGQCVGGVGGVLIDLGVSRFLNTDQLDSTLVDGGSGYCVNLTGHTQFDGFHNPVDCHLPGKLLYLTPFDGVGIVRAGLQYINDTLLITSLGGIADDAVRGGQVEDCGGTFQHCAASDYKGAAAGVDLIVEHGLQYNLRADASRITHCDCGNRFDFAHRDRFLSGG